MSIAEITDGRQLMDFVQAFDKMEGKYLASQLAQVLSHPAVFVFGELLALPNVQKLAQDPATKPHYDQLEMFAYGTFHEYQARSDLPKLTERQERKLKQLTIVSLASKNRAIPYELLSEKLQIDKIRDIEDLIIDSIYQGLVTGKLNQAKKVFEVSETFGRDVRTSDIQNMLTTLTAWQTNSSSVMSTIQERIVVAENETKAAAQRKASQQREVEDRFNVVRISLENDPKASHGYDEMVMMGASRKGAKGPRGRTG